ncbi:hypothetical protein I0C86_01510 [Plantactinospora sp. S1510]|uniref:LppX_LprAFG lipoprotein n=1 Tax=Plantactinospora alkalitolerans TaxID=2789879 RepID=A0ABS0GNN8_9ACTN|nr:hypothetical protein [Plantactinospora alkalitolerans]MBF9127679.1 hypothetical protein [Plantactinospora alkalitolerans]
MGTRWHASRALTAVVVSLALALNGCGLSGRADGRPMPVETTSRQLTPLEKLAESAARMNFTTIGVSMRAPGMTSEARLDPVGRKGTMRMELDQSDGETLVVELIRTEQDHYIRLSGLPGLPRKWMRTPAEGVTKDGALDFMPEDDPSGAVTLVRSIVDAKRDGGHTFLGTIDLTRSRRVGGRAPNEFTERMTAVPFEVFTEPQGRWSWIEIDVPSVVPELAMVRFSYHSWGEPVTVQAPQPGEIDDAPRALLEDFVEA